LTRRLVLQWQRGAQSLSCNPNGLRRNNGHIDTISELLNPRSNDAATPHPIGRSQPLEIDARGAPAPGGLRGLAAACRRHENITAGWINHFHCKGMRQ
jgi:hypothetical protein